MSFRNGFIVVTRNSEYAPEFFTLTTKEKVWGSRGEAAFYTSRSYAHTVASIHGGRVVEAHVEEWGTDTEEYEGEPSLGFHPQGIPALP